MEDCRQGVLGKRCMGGLMAVDTFFLLSVSEHSLQKRLSATRENNLPSGDWPASPCPSQYLHNGPMNRIIMMTRVETM